MRREFLSLFISSPKFSPGAFRDLGGSHVLDGWILLF